MKSNRFHPLLAAAAVSASASDSIPNSEPSLNYQVLPLAIESDFAATDSLEDVFIDHPIVESPKAGIEYKIHIVTPEPDIDYKIYIVEPKPGIDYKLRILDPDTGIEFTQITGGTGSTRSTSQE